MNHFQLFPKSVAQVIQKYNVEELRLAFTQGRWKHKNAAEVTPTPPNDPRVSTWICGNVL